MIAKQQQTCLPNLINGSQTSAFGANSALDGLANGPDQSGACNAATSNTNNAIERSAGDRGASQMSLQEILASRKYIYMYSRSTMPLTDQH